MWPVGGYTKAMSFCDIKSGSLTSWGCRDE